METKSVLTLWAKQLNLNGPNVQPITNQPDSLGEQLSMSGDNFFGFEILNKDLIENKFCNEMSRENTDRAPMFEDRRISSQQQLKEVSQNNEFCPKVEMQLFVPNSSFYTDVTKTSVLFMPEESLMQRTMELAETRDCLEGNKQFSSVNVENLTMVWELDSCSMTKRTVNEVLGQDELIQKYHNRVQDVESEQVDSQVPLSLCPTDQENNELDETANACLSTQRLAMESMEKLDVCLETEESIKQWEENLQKTRISLSSTHTQLIEMQENVNSVLMIRDSMGQYEIRLKEMRNSVEESKQYIAVHEKDISEYLQVISKRMREAIHMEELLSLRATELENDEEEYVPENTLGQQEEKKKGCRTSKYVRSTQRQLTEVRQRVQAWTTTEDRLSRLFDDQLHDLQSRVQDAEDVILQVDLSLSSLQQRDRELDDTRERLELTQRQLADIKEWASASAVTEECQRQRGRELKETRESLEVGQRQLKGMQQQVLIAEESLWQRDNELNETMEVLEDTRRQLQEMCDRVAVLEEQSRLQESDPNGIEVRMSKLYGAQIQELQSRLRVSEEEKLQLERELIDASVRGAMTSPQRSFGSQEGLGLTIITDDSLPLLEMELSTTKEILDSTQKQLMDSQQQVLALEDSLVHREKELEEKVLQLMDIQEQFIASQENVISLMNMERPLSQLLDKRIVNRVSSSSNLEVARFQSESSPNSLGQQGNELEVIRGILDDGGSYSQVPGARKQVDVLVRIEDCTKRLKIGFDDTRENLNRSLQQLRGNQEKMDVLLNAEQYLSQFSKDVLIARDNIENCRQCIMVNENEITEYLHVISKLSGDFSELEESLRQRESDFMESVERLESTDWTGEDIDEWGMTSSATEDSVRRKDLRLQNARHCLEGTQRQLRETQERVDVLMQAEDRLSQMYDGQIHDLQSCMEEADDVMLSLDSSLASLRQWNRELEEMKESLERTQRQLKESEEKVEKLVEGLLLSDMELLETRGSLSSCKKYIAIHEKDVSEYLQVISKHMQHAVHLEELLRLRDIELEDLKGLLNHAVSELKEKNGGLQMNDDTKVTMSSLSLQFCSRTESFNITEENNCNDSKRNSLTNKRTLNIPKNSITYKPTTEQEIEYCEQYFEPSSLQLSTCGQENDVVRKLDDVHTEDNKQTNLSSLYRTVSSMQALMGLSDSEDAEKKELLTELQERVDILEEALSLKSRELDETRESLENSRGYIAVHGHDVAEYLQVISKLTLDLVELQESLRQRDRELENMRESQESSHEAVD